MDFHQQMLRIYRELVRIVVFFHTTAPTSSCRAAGAFCRSAFANTLHKRALNHVIMKIRLYIFLFTIFIYNN